MGLFPTYLWECILKMEDATVTAWLCEFEPRHSHHLHLKYLQQKATHLLGGFLRSLGGRRGSDFCEKFTFRENFSQKNFLKKFSNFPENHLTTARKSDII